MSDAPVLLEHPLSPYAQKNKIALREKGVAFELALPAEMGGTGGKHQVSLAANPRREVPALLHGPVTVFDSTIIQEYIEETWPDPPLLPTQPAERARMRMIEDVMDTQYEAAVWGIMEVLTFGRAPGRLGESLVARAREQLAALHRWLEREVGERQWFAGGGFGWGDAAVAPFVLNARFYDAGPEPRSLLGRWLSRALERDSVAKTAREAQAYVEAAGDAAAQALRSGAYQREYRDHRLEWMLRSGGMTVVEEGLAAGNIRFSVEVA